MKRLGSVIASLLLTTSFYGGFVKTSNASSISKGQSFAQTHCTRCHVVGNFNPHGGISSTPSFQLIVNALKDWQERFNTFYARPPHPAVIIIESIKKQDDLPYNAAPVKMTLKDVKNITAFARTLKKK